VTNQFANAEWHWTKYEKWNCCQIPDWLNLDSLQSKFNQNLEQVNGCDNSECINKEVNAISVSSNNDDNLQQTIIQSNKCEAGATCINFAGNIYLLDASPVH
jgi:hypothetical protein